jgi:hypothetical protein
MEPWNVSFSLSQLARYTPQIITLSSSKMLNVNMTFGMAMTVKKIKDRVLESVKQAEVMAKQEQGKKVTPEEVKESQTWRRHLLSS